MNNFSLVLITPIFLNIISAFTLFISFKNKIDASGRYFLLAELLWLFVLLFVFYLNIYQGALTSIHFYIFSTPALISELSILFSIKNLEKKTEIGTFYHWTTFILVYSGLVEFFRTYLHPILPIILFSSFSLFITLITYIACIKIKNKILRENIFLKWIAYAELALISIHVIRFSSVFSATPVVTINPSSIAIIVFSVWFTTNLFRYFSYQSLRISWVDQNLENENFLNQNISKIVYEKNHLLAGLISSNRALGLSALAHSLAHQMSQPLTGLILQSESVKRDLIEQGNQDKPLQVLDIVTEQLKKLSDLVNNLRKLFSKNEPLFEPFSLQQICEEVFELITPSLNSNRISLIKHIGKDIIIIGNPIQIQQVLINLINNAAESIENSHRSDRKIEFRIFESHTYAVISISDSGDGIRHEIENSLFELYQSTKPDGLGIGLWLSREIIERHGGEIMAGNLPSGGARFEIRIPLNQKNYS